MRLITHDSFSVSDGLFDHFTLETGIDVEVVNAGDAGELVSRAVLTAGQPEADVLYGVDNTFLQRALDAGIFRRYSSPGLSSVPDEFKLDPENRVTPIDYGDVCLNYWTDRFDGAVPTSIDDLTRPEFASTFVTQDPESSSPGFAFLLATIAVYGEDGWQDYWQDLSGQRRGGHRLGGPRPTAASSSPAAAKSAIVMSYASSPVAELLFADPRRSTTPPTGVIAADSRASGPNRVRGRSRRHGAPGAAAGNARSTSSSRTTFQEDIPLNMFIFPVERRCPATPPVVRRVGAR